MQETPMEGVEHERLRALVEAGLTEATALRDAVKQCQAPADAIPGFRITEEIGRGGMGVVYKALQESTKRVVALKVMLAGWFASENSRRRFQREVELAARFQHPGIVRVLESGLTSTGNPYYAMDYVEGLQLNDWLAEARPDVRTTLRLFLGICEAVEHAHQHNVIHRDLKPTNVLVDPDGKPRILDFGLSKAIDRAGGDGSLSVTVSAPGHVLGTLRYLSPEQAAGTPSEIDARTDIYALGIMLYEALTGALPFDASGSTSDVMVRIQESSPRPPSLLSKDVDRELETIILKALEKDKLRRYECVADLAADIERYLAGDPIFARPPSRFYLLHKRLVKHRLRIAAAVGAAVLALGAVCAGVWWKGRALEREQVAARAAVRQRVLEIQREIELGHAYEYRAELLSIQNEHPQLPEARLAYAQAQLRIARQIGDESQITLAELRIRRRTSDNALGWAYCALLAEIHEDSGGSPSPAQLRAQADRDTPDTATGWYLRSFATLDSRVAAEHARSAVARDHGYDLAWQRLAHLCVLNHDVDGAVRAAKALVELGRDSYKWLLFQGRLLARAGRFQGAIDRYTAAVAAAPTDTNAYDERAGVFVCMGNCSRALEDYTWAHHFDGDEGSVWRDYKRATPTWMLGQLEQAAADYRTVRARLGRVSHADARLFLVLQDRARRAEEAGQVEVAQRNREEANQVLRDGLDKVVPESWLETVLQCLAGERTPAELVDIALTKRPSGLERLCEAYYYAAEAFLLQGQVDEAQKLFQTCVDTGMTFDPDSSSLDPMNEYHLARWRLEQLGGQAKALSE